MSVTELDRVTLEKLVGWIVDKRQALHEATCPAKPAAGRGHLEDFFGDEIPEEGVEDVGAFCLEAVKVIDEQTLHWGHNGFFAYFPITTSPAIVTGELLAAFNSPFPADHPRIEKAEAEICETYARMFNLPKKYDWDSENGVSMVCTTIGNCSLMSVHVAKSKKIRELSGSLPKAEVIKKLIAYYPGFSHSHCVKALTLNGIYNIRKIPVKLQADGNYSQDLDELRKTIEEDKQKGFIPFFIYGAHGATSCCGLDDLEDLAKLAHEHKASFAVDSAYSGVYLSLDKYKDQIKWMDNVDFLMINLAKMGYTGNPSALFYHCERKEHYLSLNQEVPQDCKTNPKPSALRLGKDTKLGLWKMQQALSFLGVDGYKREWEASEQIADYIRNFVANDPKQRFEEYPKSQFALVCVRAKIHKTDDLTHEEWQQETRKANLEVMGKIDADGKYVVMGADLNGDHFLRFSCKPPAKLSEYDRMFKIMQDAYDSHTSFNLGDN